VPPLPLGLASVAASLARAHAVKVLDFMCLDDRRAELKRTVADFKPQIIGISVRNIDNQASRAPESYFPA